MSGATPTYDTGALLTLTNAGNTTLVSPDQNNYFSNGVIVVANLTVLAGNVTLHIRGKDQASGLYYDLLDSAALTGNGTTVYTVYPGAPATANVSVSSPLPAVWGIEAVISAAGNVSGTIGASVIAG